jgi:acyl carrier protein
VTVADVEARILAVAREATGNAGGADPLADGSLDSVAMVRLLAGVEDAFGITLPPADITPENFASLSALTALVHRLAP